MVKGEHSWSIDICGFKERRYWRCTRIRLNNIDNSDARGYAWVRCLISTLVIKKALNILSRVFSLLHNDFSFMLITTASVPTIRSKKKLQISNRKSGSKIVQAVFSKQLHVRVPPCNGNTKLWMCTLGLPSFWEVRLIGYMWRMGKVLLWERHEGYKQRICKLQALPSRLQHYKV